MIDLGDPYANLDDLVREIDRALHFLKKIKSAQVRNAEHRDFLRATALSWFHTRRSDVAQNMGPEIVEQIDIPYRTILNAADKHSSKNTYIEAAKLAKQSLVEARSRALIPTPTPAAVRSADSAPNFAPLVSDPAMQSILERRWDECKRCIDAGAPLAATVMMGGL